MFDTLFIGAADAERNHQGDVLDDGADTVLNRSKRRIEADRHVAAADIEPHTRDADLPLVCDHATDWLGIAEVTVGADDAADDIAHRHAVAHLSNRRVVVSSEHPQRAIHVPRYLW